MSHNDADGRPQDLRDASTHVVVTLPHTDGELAHALGELEVLLLLLVPEDPEDDVALPASLATPHGAHAVGRLASYVAETERQEPAVQPIAPDGRFELVPLFFARLGRAHRDRLTAAVVDLVDIKDLVADYMDSREEAQQLLSRAQRLVALLHLPWDDDVARLHGLLDREEAPIAPTERVVLTPDELAAYQRVTERILATWHANDPLERVLYRGA